MFYANNQFVILHFAILVKAKKNGFFAQTRPTP